MCLEIHLKICKILFHSIFPKWQKKILWIHKSRYSNPTNNKNFPQSLIRRQLEKFVTYIIIDFPENTLEQVQEFVQCIYLQIDKRGSLIRI